MEDTKICPRCRKEKTLEFFKYGLKSCDKCTDYSRQWKRSKAQEEEKLNPTTFCETCGMRIKLYRWEEHIRAKRHRTETLREEYKVKIAEANETERTPLRNEMNMKIREVLDTPYEILYKDITP